MITRFVEVTDGVAYGKFLICRMDVIELSTPTAMPDAPAGQRLLTYAGRRQFSERTTLVVDLQRGTAAAWPLENGEIGMVHYLDGKLSGLDRLVCPMYLPFVRWLHLDGRWAEGAGDILAIPAYLKLEPAGMSQLLSRLLEADRARRGGS
jgi:hypothetical protein